MQQLNSSNNLVLICYKVSAEYNICGWTDTGTHGPTKFSLMIPRYTLRAGKR